MAHDVFLSYSSKDKAVADAACAVLERGGIRVWMAPRDIMPGMGWAPSIIGAINATQVMVLIFTAHANASPQIEREVERAINKGVPVVPFRLENVLPSDALEYFISTPHWLDAFTPPLEQHLERLADTCKRLLESDLLRRPGRGTEPTNWPDAASAAIADALMASTTPGPSPEPWPEPVPAHESVPEIARVTAPLTNDADPDHPSPIEISSESSLPKPTEQNDPVSQLELLPASDKALEPAKEAATATSAALSDSDVTTKRPESPPPPPPRPMRDRSNEPVPLRLPETRRETTSVNEAVSARRRPITVLLIVSLGLIGATILLIESRWSQVSQTNESTKSQQTQPKPSPPAESAADQTAKGDDYFYGRGVPINYWQAMFWYRKAADHGWAIAQFNLGYMFELGIGASKNLELAAGWYREAAMGGNLGAKAALARLAEEASKPTVPAQEAAADQYAKGVAFAEGRGGPKDYKQAMVWLVKAAGQGNSAAQNYIGYLYTQGLDVPIDYEQAMIWFRKAAAQGNTAAQYNIGMFYQNGFGVQRDYLQSLTWYLKAANQGDATAQVTVGSFYKDGVGVPIDYEQAITWYRKAADQGNALAQNAIGYFYQAGHGVPTDYAQAMIWYRKAAEQGDAAAQVHIGVLFESGLGMTKNNVEALSWYSKAADQGDEAAIAAVNRLSRSR